MDTLIEELLKTEPATSVCNLNWQTIYALRVNSNDDPIHSGTPPVTAFNSLYRLLARHR